TDMAANENGCLVLEEYAERISFFDWDGNQNILWDGLGSPTSFTIVPNQTNRYLVAETVPKAGLSTVGNLIVRPAALPDELSNTSIHGILSTTTKTYLSVTDTGEIIVLDNAGEYETLTSQLLTPTKLLKGVGNSIWAFDLYIGQIAKLDGDTGKFLQTANGGAIGIIDFDVEIKDGTETVYGLDTTGDIWVYTAAKNLFTPLTLLTLELDYDFTNTFTPVIARVPDEGCVVAMNDLKGSIVWIDDDGEQEVIATGFKDIVQMQAESRNRITVLSNRGWLRTISLTYPSDVPEPTPTPINTPTPIIPTRTPTPDRPETPSPTPMAPTPTPTEATSVFDWWIHDSK
ncbi:hypothetical protein K8I31_22090, partial [bacterium]|nr:hypothetical protein [bacterium]